MRAPFAALLLFLASWSGAATAAPGCPQQPVPAPLESVRSPGSVFVLELLSFSATPSLTFPREAWVVRAYRETVFEQARREHVVLEVVRMQVEYDCNRHFVTGQWRGEISPERYAALRESVVPFLEPLAGALQTGTLAPPQIAIDGTSVAVELAASDWRLRRDGHASVSGGGREMSTVFHALAAELVPADEMPTAEWRPARGTR